MMGLRLLEEQARRIAELLFVDGNEAAALALCGRSMVRDPWSGGGNERFIVREIIEVPTTAYLSRSRDEFTWKTEPFYNALKRAEAKELAVAVFHSHPDSVLHFSAKDDVADEELFAIAFNRLESRRPHLSVIMDRGGGLAARAYGPNLKPETITAVGVIGEMWRFSGQTYRADVAAELDRQVRAFGKASTAAVAGLRVGVVGCGGTGSAVVALLSRIGVRRLVVCDADHVDETSLNRMHFSTRRNASLLDLKVEVVASGAANIGLPMSIVRIPRHADHPDALAALRACDVVFGCTDDNLGREVLNHLAHFYFIPVIDLGLLIEPNDGGYDTFDGRVTIVQPGYPCQHCRGLITGNGLHLDALRRNPALLQERRRAGYVPQDPDPSPVVVTFTTEVATMAVNELFHRLNGFRGATQRCSERVRRFDVLKDCDTLPAGKPREGCPLCEKRSYDGRGDMQPLLNLSL